MKQSRNASRSGAATSNSARKAPGAGRPSRDSAAQAGATQSTRATRARRADGPSGNEAACASTQGLEASKRAALESLNRQLTQERNFAATVLETVAALVVVFDHGGRIMRWNSACAAASGLEAKAVLGRVFWRLGLIPREQIPELRQAFERLRKGEARIRRESHWHAADGSVRIIAWTNTCLRNAAGELEYVLGTGIDITEQRRAESDSRAHLNALLHAHRTTTAGELAGALAHEVNQPLSAITNLCEATLLQLGDTARPPAGVVENLQAIATQAQRAGRIIHDLRAFIARREIEEIAMDVNALVRAACDLVRPEASEHRIRIMLDLAEEVLEADVAAIRIEHALVNLLQNAIESIRTLRRKNGVVRVTTRRGPRGAVELSVADNGNGFDAAARERAFEPFFTTKKNGLGLGLAIARSVVEASGGRLWLDVAQPVGATLHISLPGAP